MAEYTLDTPDASVSSVDDLLGPDTVDGILGSQSNQKPPVTTVEPSKGLLKRMVGNPAFDYIMNSIDKDALEGWGNDPVGLDPDTYEALKDIGLYNKPGQYNPIRTLNAAVITPVAALTDTVIKGINATIRGAGGGVGALVEVATGDKTEGQKARAELINFSNFMMATGGGPNALFSPRIGAFGKLDDVNVGGLPKTDEFKKVAEVAGDAKAEPIVKQLYDEHGILPAEVVDDIATDVTIAQDLLAGEVPGVYAAAKIDGGGKPPVPPSEAGPLPELPAPKSGKAAVVADAQKKILDKIDVGSHDKKRGWSFERLYYNLVDDLNPIKVATQKALKRFGKDKLEVGEDPYSLFRLTRGVFGKADQFLIHSPFKFDSYANNGKSLKAILAPIDKDLDGLRAFVAAKRATELEAKGLTSGFDMEAAGAVIAGGKKYEKVHQELVAYQNKLSEYLKDAGVLNDKAYEAMIQANKDYVPFYRLMDGEIVGPIGNQSRRGLGAKNPIKQIKGSDLAIIDPLESVIKNTYAYISLAEKNAAGVKLVDLLKSADDGSSYLTDLIPYPDKPKGNGPTNKLLPAPTELRALEGEVIPPTESGAGKFLARQDSKIIDEYTGRPLIEYVPDQPNYIDVDFKEIIPDKDLRVVITTAGRVPDGETIHIFRNGKRETYRINDPDLLAAWRGLDRYSADILQRILSVPASTLRAGAVLTPEFLTRNLIRDFFSAVVNTQGGIFSPIDTVKGFKSYLSKDQSFQDWLKGGGANSALVSMDRKYLQENLFKLNAQTGLAERSWNVVTTPIRALRMTSELFENATRLGEFRKLMKDKSGKLAIQKAAMGSREVTLDFARIGAQMRAWNMIDAFLNASIQGPDRLMRQFKHKPVSTATKIAGGVMAPSALLWYANHDDPRYKELPDWQKDLFWIVLTEDTIYRIPKPFETGVIFGSGLERSLDKLYADNPKALDGFTQSLTEMLIPSIVPTAGVPILEQFSNRSYLTGEKLVSEYNEKFLPEYQYTPYTTETAKALGRMFAAFPGMREASKGQTPLNGVAKAISTPILLENYIREWTGGLGTYALQLTDTALRKAGLVPDPVRPLATLSDIPVVKAFVVRYPTANTKSIQSFYARNAANIQVMTTLDKLAASGDFGAATAVLDTYGPRTSLASVQQSLGEMSQLIRDINQLPSITPQEKRQLIDTIYFNMIEISKTGNQMLDEMDKVIEENK